ncbi:unnamed protein product, partial [Polarella glacialis]
MAPWLVFRRSSLLVVLLLAGKVESDVDRALAADDECGAFAADGCTSDFLQLRKSAGQINNPGAFSMTNKSEGRDSNNPDAYSIPSDVSDEGQSRSPDAFSVTNSSGGQRVAQDQVEDVYSLPRDIQDAYSIPPSVSSEGQRDTEAYERWDDAYSKPSISSEGESNNQTAISPSNSSEGVSSPSNSSGGVISPSNSSGGVVSPSNSSGGVISPPNSSG